MPERHRSESTGMEGPIYLLIKLLINLKTPLCYDGSTTRRRPDAPLSTRVRKFDGGVEKLM